MSYKKFLENKPLFYSEIDYERMPRIWREIKHHFKLPKIIQIIGTNGKGTTGRFLAYMLYQNGLSVAHYTSPHILEFNERIWKNKRLVDDIELQKAHIFLQTILDKNDLETLSYFEYTTLMAIYLFQDCKYAILEAGMGGEYDATTVFGNDLSLLTPVDFDHQEFLGDSIKQIAMTKLKSVQKRVIVADQHYKEVLDVVEELSKKRGFEVIKVDALLDESVVKILKDYSYKESLPKFLEQNLFLAASACKFLGFDIKLPRFTEFDMMGRCQKIANNITIDVGHNILAAKVLREHFNGKKVVLVYNSYKDKESKRILSILKPIIKRVEILNVNNARIQEREKLINYIRELNLSVNDFISVDLNEEYLVFGSFSVIERFLKDNFER